MFFSSNLLFKEVLVFRQLNECQESRINLFTLGDYCELNDYVTQLLILSNKRKALLTHLSQILTSSPRRPPTAAQLSQHSKCSNFYFFLLRLPRPPPILTMTVVIRWIVWNMETAGILTPIIAGLLILDMKSAFWILLFPFQEVLALLWRSRATLCLQD